MKKIAIIAILIAAMASPILAKNAFKEGNSRYFSGDYAGALGEYSKFIQKNQKKYEGYYNAGNALFRQEKYEDALGMYNRALELKPKDEDTKYNIEVTQERIKNQPKDKKQDPSTGSGQKQNQEQNNQQGGKGQDNKQGQDKQQGNQDAKNNKDNQQQQQAGKDGKNGQQQGQGQGPSTGSGQGSKTEEQKQEEARQQAAAQQQARKEQAQKSLGMSEDEVQAVLNNYNKQEKQYRQYFGQRNRPQNDELSMPNFFNMSPQEIMDYMEKRSMMQPYGNEQPKKQGNEKDW